MIRGLLDKIGSLFVYKSPDPGESYRNFLLSLPSRELKKRAGTQTHHSKKRLVDIILTKTG